MNKKLNFLKEKEAFPLDLQEKFNIFEKKVENIEKINNKDDLQEKVEILEKKVDNIEKTNKQVVSEDIKNICEKCVLVAKSEPGLKVHVKAIHTRNKVKCWKCDFAYETKSELTKHNDSYYYSHRIGYYPHRKKDYLEEFEHLTSTYVHSCVRQTNS